MNRRQASFAAAAGLLVLAAIAVAGLYGPLPSADGNPTPTPDETPRLEYEGERLTLEAASGQTIEGRTDLEPGSVVSIQLRASGGDPFLRSRTAAVDDDGAFRATFDLSEVSAGTSFDVVVRHNGTRLLDENGTVVA